MSNADKSWAHSYKIKKLVSQVLNHGLRLSMSWSNNLLEKKMERFNQFSTLKNDFEIFEEIVHYFGKTDHDPDGDII